MTTRIQQLCFFAVSLCILFFMPKPVLAQCLPVEGDLTLAATQCSDNTEIYITRNGFLQYSNVYVFKDKKLIFSEEGNDDILYARSILCLKQGIVIIAIHGNAFSTLVLKSDNGKLSLETLGYRRNPAEVHTTAQETIINLNSIKYRYGLFGGWDEEESKQIKLKNTFTATVGKDHPTLTMRPQVSNIQDINVHLTSRSWGYVGDALSDYNAEAYIARDGTPYVFCWNDYKTTKNIHYPPVKLPFVATSGVMGEDNKHYLFGQKDNALQAVELIFDKETQRFRVEPRDPDTIPFKPYLPEYSEGGPEKPIYSMKELKGEDYKDEW